MKIIGASLGECVHIQGVWSALERARGYGYDTVFLGPALSVEQLIAAVRRENPDAVALSYRLTPETGEAILKELSQTIEREGATSSIDYLFGGTPSVAEKAKATGLFKVVVDGTNVGEFEQYLQRERGGKKLSARADLGIPPQEVTARINQKKPRPILRTHYGQPTVQETVMGIGRIADSGLIDIISLGTDQDAQANFFHSERQVLSRAGAGGVPVRSPEDFTHLFEATRTGNYPMMRTYAGTDDLIKLAEMYETAFGNAWSAVPIFWFNDMDGRGPHSLEKSVREHFKLIRWNVEHDIPVEILESHHWGMRWAHDTIQIASAALGAGISKVLGVQNYIHQYMFHLPPSTSCTNELAKMKAVREMIEGLEDESFTIYHQTRAGLPSFPCNLEAARGQLASSTMLQMQLSPDIVHVVNYSEPYHAATADDVINSAQIVEQTVDNALGAPSMLYDPKLQKRKEELEREAKVLLSYIHEYGDIADPHYVHSLVALGLFDAPMLINNRYAQGKVRTAIVDGGCYAVDEQGKIMHEQQRIAQLAAQKGN